jgi:hypothetical protein
MLSAQEVCNTADAGLFFPEAQGRVPVLTRRCTRRGGAMSTRAWRSGGIGALAGAPLLLGLSLFAASPARAQVCDEAQEAAYEVFVALAEGLSELADQAGSEPTEGDCANVCRISESLCMKENRLTYKLVRTAIKKLAQASKRLCRTAANPSACKGDTRAAKRQAMMIAREVRNLLIRACSDADVTRACEDLCNAADPWEEIPNCCEEIFHDVTCVAPLGALSIPPPPPPPPSGGGFIGSISFIADEPAVPSVDPEP